MSPAEAHPRRYGSWSLYLWEMRLLMVRRRNQALLAVLAAIPVLIGVAVLVNSPRPGQGPQFIGRITGNGLFLIFTAITVSLPVFLPITVGVVAGDAIAGEAAQGTLRSLLAVPVPRGRLLWVKTAAIATFTALAVGVVAVVALATGAALFGLHSLVLLSGDTVSLGSGLLRTLGVVGYVTLALFGLAAIGLCVSCFTDNALAAMAATVGIAVFSAILDAVPQVAAIHPALLTDHWLGFGELLRSSVSAADLIRWSALHAAYAVCALSLAWARLRSTDVTS